MWTERSDHRQRGAWLLTALLALLLTFGLTETRPPAGVTPSSASAAQLITAGSGELVAVVPTVRVSVGQHIALSLDPLAPHAAGAPRPAVAAAPAADGWLRPTTAESGAAGPRAPPLSD